jgi:hypothetical protein
MDNFVEKQEKAILELQASGISPSEHSPYLFELLSNIIQVRPPHYNSIFMNIVIYSGSMFVIFMACGLVLPIFDFKECLITSAIGGPSMAVFFYIRRRKFNFSKWEDL